MTTVLLFIAIVALGALLLQGAVTILALIREGLDKKHTSMPKVILLYVITIIYVTAGTMFLYDITVMKVLEEQGWIPLREAPIDVELNEAINTEPSPNLVRPKLILPDNTSTVR